MNQLITSLTEARENIINYNQCMAGLRTYSLGVQASMLNTISHAQVWLAINEGGWLLAPAKYVGYRDITPDDYHRFRRTMSGSKASGRLDELGVAWEPLPPRHAACRALNQFASLQGKAHREGTSVYLLPGEDLKAGDRMAAEGILELIGRAKLSGKAIEYIQVRLGAMLA